jgi:hypothetical protein
MKLYSQDATSLPAFMCETLHCSFSILNLFILGKFKIYCLPYLLHMNINVLYYGGKDKSTNI